MKNTILGSIAVIIAVVGAAYVSKPVINVDTAAPVINVPQGKAPIVNVEAARVSVPATVVNVPSQKEGGQTFGSVTGPDLYSSYWNVNGYTIFPNYKGLSQGTSTVCSIKSPTATSSLSYAAIRFNLASTSATYVEMAQATNPFATTTRISSVYTIAAGAQATIVASSTQDISTLFPPNTYFNVNVAWATAPTAASVPVGACEAVFTKI